MEVLFMQALIADMLQGLDQPIPVNDSQFCTPCGIMFNLFAQRKYMFYKPAEAPVFPKIKKGLQNCRPFSLYKHLLHKFSLISFALDAVLLI